MAGSGARKRAGELAVVALASGLTQVAAAKAAGIGPRTLTRWLRTDPEFRAQLEQARAAVFERAADTAASRVEQALATLESLLTSEFEFARLGAARAIVESACRLREIVDLSERVSRIEERLLERNSHGTP